LKRAYPEGESPWYSMTDLMRLFDVSKGTILNWEADGKIPRAVRMSRKWTRWPKAAVDAVLRSMRENPPP